MRSVTAAVLTITTIFAMSGCGDSGDPEAAPPPSSAASTTTPASDGDLSDDQRTCLTAGQIVVDAAVPSAEGEPAAGPATLELNERIRGALDQLDDLQALGEVAEGINELEFALGQMSAIAAATSGRSFAIRRADLTAAVTQLQSTCREAGVPDFLNP